MAIDKLKVMLSFMREINDGNIPNSKDYDMTDEEFGSIIEVCQDEGLIKRAGITRDGSGKVYALILSHTLLTVKGMEYLHEHSKVMQTYKGLKEIREWLPF